jgi:hypothetical protein
MSDQLTTLCTEIEVVEALNLACLLGKDSQVVKVVRRLAYERDILRSRVNELEKHLALHIEMRTNS